MMRVTPWVALVIATSFGCYGLLKKGLPLGPVLSVTAEVCLLVPIALVVWAVFAAGGTPLFGNSVTDALLLIGSGIMTGVPLFLFSMAARRVTMSTLGLLQYLNPTLQFLAATLVLHEPFGLWQAITFGIIWTALAIYWASAHHREKARVRQATTSSADVAT